MTDRMKETPQQPQGSSHSAARDGPHFVEAGNSDRDEELTARQRADLNDPEKQHRYRMEYLLQILRRQCPGCGRDEVHL